MSVTQVETVADTAAVPLWHNRIHGHLVPEVLKSPADERAVAGLMATVLPPALLGTPTDTVAQVDAQADVVVANAIDLGNVVLSAVLHHPTMQEAMRTWTGIERLVEDPEVGDDVRVMYLEATKADVMADLEASGGRVDDTELYRMLIREGLKMVFGDPVLAAAVDFGGFGPGPQDLKLMDALARIGEAGLMAFLAAPTPGFFGVDSFPQLPLKKSLLGDALQREELSGYHAFREKPHAKYLALTFPDVAAREPFHPDRAPAAGLPDFAERVAGRADVTRIPASAAILQNLARSMTAYNWPQIVGLDYGGKIDGLVLRAFAADGRGFQVSPVEVPIDDDLEMVLQHAGLIPVRPIKSKNAAVIFEATSIKKALIGLDPNLNGSAKLATKLPVVLIESRFGHYLREAFLHLVGGALPPDQVQQQLQTWANVFVCDSKGPLPIETRAKRPFAAIKIAVVPHPEDPGRLQAEVELTPAFRIAAVSAKLIITQPAADPV